MMKREGNYRLYVIPIYDRKHDPRATTTKMSIKFRDPASKVQNLSKLDSMQFVNLKVSTTNLETSRYVCINVARLMLDKRIMSFASIQAIIGATCSFLNSLAKPETMTPRVWGDGFPKPNGDVGRPLPEDLSYAAKFTASHTFRRTGFKKQE
jgi:hypothetical protein